MQSLLEHLWENGALRFGKDLLTGALRVGVRQDLTLVQLFTLFCVVRSREENSRVTFCQTRRQKDVCCSLLLALPIGLCCFGRLSQHLFQHAPFNLSGTEAADLTSYSARRVLPKLSELCRLDSRGMLLVGDWLAAAHQQQTQQSNN